eukprot:jgi/Mesvir1/12114/Mv00376-RA.1
MEQSLNTILLNEDDDPAVPSADTDFVASTPLQKRVLLEARNVEGPPTVSGGGPAFAGLMRPTEVVDVEAPPGTSAGHYTALMDPFDRPRMPFHAPTMPDKISQRQQPVATLATLVEALRVHQVLLEDHLSNTGKHNKIEIAGLTDGEVMAFKGLARHLGFVNALPAGMDGSIPDLIRAILKGFLLPLSDADGALLEERGQWAAREQQLLASIAQLQADLAFRQGVLNTSIKDYLELQDEIKTLQEEDAREPRAALKRKLEEVTAECAQLDAEVDRKKEKLKEMEKWPVFELQRELDRSRRCLTMNADGELADVVHRRNKKTLVTRRDALLGARDSLMSFSIGMAKKSLPMLRIMRTRIATLQHKRPPAPVAWPDQEILKKHIGTGETRLSSQGVLLSLPARDKRRFDERAIAKHSRDVRDARLWVKLRDTIPGGCSVRVTAGAKKILGPVVPCEQLIQQARKDQTERVDSIVPLYRTNIAEDVTAMPDFETGVYGWQNHPTNSAQLMVMRLFLENPDSPVWRDMKVTKRAKLDIGCGGDGHRTRLGAGTMNMLAMSIRPVDPAFPDLWQRPDWVSVNLESPGGDKRANLLKNAAAWLEVIKYLAGHEIPVVLDGVEIMIKFRVFILGDMAWQWAMREKTYEELMAEAAAAQGQKAKRRGGGRRGAGQETEGADEPAQPQKGGGQGRDATAENRIRDVRPDVRMRFMDGAKLSRGGWSSKWVDEVCINWEHKYPKKEDFPLFGTLLGKEREKVVFRWFDEGHDLGWSNECEQKFRFPLKFAREHVTLLKEGASWDNIPSYRPGKR